MFAAVAISGIILSLGSIANFAFVNEEPRDFEKLTMEVKRETGKIIDYEIYSPAFDDYVFLEDFMSCCPILPRHPVIDKLIFFI